MYRTGCKKSSHPRAGRSRRWNANSLAGYERSAGFALPSVLFLVVILATLTLAILSVAYLQRTLSLREMFQVKAEYAAQSGIAVVLNELSGSQAPILPMERAYDFPDESSAIVRVLPWGLLLAVESNGVSQNVTSTRRCLAAQELTAGFDKALILGNADHSLVMTGSSRIVGDVVVGQGGVSTGSLRDYTTPFAIPIRGKVTKRHAPVLPKYRPRLLSSQVRKFEGFLIRDGITEYDPIVMSRGVLNLGEIEDTVQMIITTGELVLIGRNHRSNPLYIVSEGTVTLSTESFLTGLIGVCSNQEIIVSSGCKFENVLLFSRDSIRVGSNVRGSGQFISPTVTISQSAILHYPSFVVSIPSDDTIRQHITISGVVEGLVMMLNDITADPSDQLTIVEQAAEITGVLHSRGAVTLDGWVAGSVALRDLYFYESPTRYVGWLRQGVIERNKLPDGFMLPPEMAGTGRLGILEWM